ncbi:restriction endonuclease subunit S [Cellulosimicrobium sp. 4261]|uniref:restriction endonuclease subunit S n=1 Tax=Cellulosimicrobium sp. 4261 TaxID=3156458 RepID=UPI00339A14F2
MAEVESTIPLVRLAELCSKIGSGATPRGGSTVYQDLGIAFIRSQNVHDNRFDETGLVRINDDAADQLKGVEVQSGDVLLNITGDSVLRCCLVPDDVLPARVSQHVAILRSNGSVVPRFLQGFLVAPGVRAELLTIASGGATRKALTKAQIEAIEIPLPSLRRQHAIAEVLGALDDKIAANTRLAVTAHGLARSLLALGEPNVPVSEIAVHSRLTVNPEVMPVPRVAHYSLPAFDIGTGPEVVAPESIKSNKFLVSEPSVLVSKLNPRFPRVWNLPHLPEEPALASTEFVVLVPTACSTTVLWALTSQPRFGAALEGMVAGTSGSHQRVKPAEMLATLVPDPRRLEPSLLAQVDALGARSLAAQAENVTLAATRDTLLPQLMSGKLRVRETAEMAGL